MSYSRKYSGRAAGSMAGGQQLILLTGDESEIKPEIMSEICDGDDVDGGIAQVVPCSKMFLNDRLANIAAGTQLGSGVEVVLRSALRIWIGAEC